MFHNSCFTNLSIPDGKYLLTDAGSPTCSTLLVPYHGTWYHLSEWGHARLRYSTTTIWIYLQLTLYMPGLRTSLSKHLGWPSSTSRSWSSLQNIPWMYRQGYFLHLWQFTIVSPKEIPLILLTYYPPLMMELMLNIVVSWWQNIWGGQRKTEPMLDVKRSQRVCGTTTRQCWASKICSLIVVTQ